MNLSNIFAKNDSALTKLGGACPHDILTGLGMVGIGPVRAYLVYVSCVTDKRFVYV